MSQYQDAQFTNADGLRIAYRTWGDGDATLICVHGLYRNRHDFDILAEALSKQWRVVAVDMMGRGDSDFSPDPRRYNAEFYVRDVLALADHLQLKQFAYLGTSMGGMIGMVLAMTTPARLTKLILNDIGPQISLAVLRELGQRSTDAPASFASFQEALDYFRPAFKEWDDLSEEQVLHLTRHSVKQVDGKWVFHYDRRIVEGFVWPEGDIDLWAAYRQIACPVMVIRGVHSAVLPESVAATLKQDPNTMVLDVPGAGHAPGLMAPDQIEAIATFLGEPPGNRYG